MSAHDHLQVQVDRLQQSLVRMGERAGKSLGESVASLVARDVTLAHEVIGADSQLDRLEDEHEEQTVQIIALNQPVARDLRLLIAFLRINTSIERAGDLAVNIAQSAIRIAEEPAVRPYVDIPRTYDLVRAMWDDVIRAFLDLDDSFAQEIVLRDDAVDRVNQETIIQLIQTSRESPQFIFQVTNLIGVSKALERAADLAVDIANEVIFATRGQMLRHNNRGHARTA